MYVEATHCLIEAWGINIVFKDCLGRHLRRTPRVANIWWPRCDWRHVIDHYEGTLVTRPANDEPVRAFWFATNTTWWRSPYSKPHNCWDSRDPKSARDYSEETSCWRTEPKRKSTIGRNPERESRQRSDAGSQSSRTVQPVGGLELTVKWRPWGDKWTASIDGGNASTHPHLCTNSTLLTESSGRLEQLQCDIRDSETSIRIRLVTAHPSPPTSDSFLGKL
jgi:hypothetical protein